MSLKKVHFSVVSNRPCVSGDPKKLEEKNNVSAKEEKMVKTSKEGDNQLN